MIRAMSISALPPGGGPLAFGRQLRGRRCGLALPGRYGPDQALGPGADQILPVGFQQRFFHQIVVLGVPVLDQRPLHGFFVGVRGDVDLLHGPGVQAGIVHDGGQGGGGGVEVLDLLRVVAHLPDVFRQFDGLLQRGAGVAGHEIGHQILVHAVLLVQGEILVHELIIDGVAGLAHFGENRVGNVLRGHLELAGDVVLDQLLEEGVLLVRQQVVKADAAADEYLFYPGDLPQLAKQRHIIRMVGLHVLTGGGVEALAAAAGALGELLFAGRMAEIGGGAADIVDVALEILVLDHHFRFRQDGVMAAGLDDAALVEGQGAEGAGAEAAPVADQAEFYFLNGGDTAGLRIAGVPGPLIGQGVNVVHFLGGQGLLGRILDDVEIAVGLRQPLGGEGVAVAVLNFEGFGVFAAVLFQLVIGRKHQGGQALVQLGGLEHCAVDVGDVPDLHARVQGVGDLHDALFAHAVHEQVRLGIQQDGALQAFGPVIVVGQPPQAGFNAADEDGDVLVGLADQVAVDHGGVVGPLAHDAAGGEGVGLAPVLGDGVMVHHGIHIAAGHQEAQPGPAVDADGLGVLPVGLGDDADAVAVAFQHPADDGVAEGRMIHIGVADDIYEIALFPAPVQHILFADGKKAHRGPPMIFC